MNAFAQPPLDGRPKLVLRETPELTDEDREALRTWAPNSIFVIVDEEYNICDIVAGEQFFHTLPSDVMKQYKLANMLHPEDVPYVHEDIIRAQALEPSVSVLFRVWSTRGFYSAMEGASRFLIYSSSRSRVVYQVNRIVGPNGKVLDPEENPVLNVYQEKLHGIVKAVLDPRFVFINVSPASQTVLGCMPSWLVNSRLIDHVDLADRRLCEEFQRECAALILTMPVQHSCRLSIRRRDGLVRQFLVSVTPFNFPSLGTCFDTTLQLLHDAARDSTLACSIPETSTLAAAVAAAAPTSSQSSDTFMGDESFDSRSDMDATPQSAVGTTDVASPRPEKAKRSSSPTSSGDKAGKSTGGSSSSRRRSQAPRRPPPAVIDGVFCYYPQKRAYKTTNARKTAPADRRCVSCQSSVTPEWRRGPDGTKSLCNACGLMYAKLCKAQAAKAAASPADGGATAVLTPSDSIASPAACSDAESMQTSMSVSPTLSSTASPAPVVPQLEPLEPLDALGERDAGSGKAVEQDTAGRLPQMFVLSWNPGTTPTASTITATESPWGGVSYSSDPAAAPPTEVDALEPASLDSSGSGELLGLDLSGLTAW